MIGLPFTDKINVLAQREIACLVMKSIVQKQHLIYWTFTDWLMGTEGVDFSYFPKISAMDLLSFG